MHLMATNICVLIVTAVMETNEDYRLQNYIVNNVTLEGEITLPPPTDYKNVQASWDWLRFLYIVKRTVNASKSKDKNLTTCPNKIIIRICNRSYFIFQRNQELLWGGHSGEVGFALLIPLHHHLQHHRGRHHLSSVSVHWGPHQTEVAKPHFLHKFGSHGCFRYRLRQS